MLLYQILACAIRGKKQKKLYKNNEFKISTPNKSFKDYQ